jgi:hypothetical protein
MNPLRWVRWKLVVVFAVAGGALYFLGLNPLARWQINSVGETNPAARWRVAGVGLGLLTGDFELDDLWVDSARKRREAKPAAASGNALKEDALKEDALKEDALKEIESKVFQALRSNFDVNTTELLRRRLVVDEVRIDGPRMNVVRRPDGSSNLGDLGAEEEAPAGPTEPAGETKRAEDWLETAKKWYERLQKVHEKLGKLGRKKEADEAEKQEAQRRADYYARRSTYPFEDRPSVLVSRIVASGMELSFTDEGDAAAALPTLVNGTLEVKDLSSSPSLHQNPIRLEVGGDLVAKGQQLTEAQKADGKPDLKLIVDVDFRGDAAKYSVDVGTGMLDAAVVNAFAGKSLPVVLKKGRIGLEAKLGLDGAGALLVEPRMKFQGVELAAKPETSKLAGLDASQFVSAFNEASGQLGDTALEIADLRITGTLERPRFEWGDTVKNLVVQGGKAFAAKKLDEVKARAGAEIEKGIDKVLGGSEAGKKLKEGLEGLTPKDGLEGAAKDGLDRLQKGLFGGGDKKDEKKKESP